MQGSLDPMYREGARRVSRRGEDDRSTARIISAAIVAGGLAFSASLYPVPGLPSPAQLWQQEQETIAGLPGHIRTFVAGQLVDLTTVEAPALAHLAEILHDRFPGVRTEVFLSILANRSFTEVVRTFGILMAAGSPLTASAALTAGGGTSGGDGASMTLPFPDLTSLLQLLLQRMPAYLAHEVIAALFPASATSALINVVTAAVSPPQSVSNVVSPPEVNIAPPPAPVVTPPTDVRSFAPPAPEAPPATEVDTAPPAMETPSPHVDEVPAIDIPSPAPEILPEVLEQVPVIDEHEIDEHIGSVGGDETAGSDDDDSPVDDVDDSLGSGDVLDDVESAIDSDDTSPGAGAGEQDSAISAVLSDADDRPALSISRLSASSGDDDGGSSQHPARGGDDSTANASDGEHSGDAGD